MAQPNSSNGSLQQGQAENVNKMSNSTLSKLAINAIQIFDGTSKVETFIENLEDAAKLTKLEDHEIVTIARLKLVGRAKDFLDSEPSLKGVIKFDILKAALIDRFRKFKLPNTVLIEFNNCKQLQNEPIREFVSRLKTLGYNSMERSSDAAEQVFIKKRLEVDMKRIFLLGLADAEIKKRVMSQNPETLSQTVEIALNEEIIEAVCAKTRNINLVENKTPENTKLQNSNKSHQFNKDKFNQNFADRSNQNINRTQFYQNKFNSNRNPQNQNYYVNRDNWKPNRNFTYNQGNQSNFSRSNIPRYQSNFSQNNSSQNINRHIKCFKCGKLGHYSNKCNSDQRFKNDGKIICFKCKKEGHVAIGCRSLNSDRLIVKPRTMSRN